MAVRVGAALGHEGDARAVRRDRVGAELHRDGEEQAAVHVHAEAGELAVLEGRDQFEFIGTMPCFRFGDVAAWGQDRLWVIEDAIRNQTPHGMGR